MALGDFRKNSWRNIENCDESQQEIDPHVVLSRLHDVCTPEDLFFSDTYRVHRYPPKRQSLS